eukprot:CAMPEP_0204557656 /NCGR_PEP_ID=MMETSP0661-20131031/30486_1 /ASSEMBLY_ACC=CAM_ASM_000606 /TAXON_ID=109239 /ORGANISM="Alexandrium margalefi, Strain AMGDE01CS-322" /LENGTH=35 /DNA_ID= /DNA_START= /DNA_END= /DNA_ORIENTATION=
MTRTSSAESFRATRSSRVALDSRLKQPSAAEAHSL